MNQSHLSSCLQTFDQAKTTFRAHSYCSPFKNNYESMFCCMTQYVALFLPDGPTPCNAHFIWVNLCLMQCENMMKNDPVMSSHQAAAVSMPGCYLGSVFKRKEIGVLGRWMAVATGTMLVWWTMVWCCLIGHLTFSRDYRLLQSGTGQLKHYMATKYMSGDSW